MLAFYNRSRFINPHETSILEKSDFSVELALKALSDGKNCLSLHVQYTGPEDIHLVPVKTRSVSNGYIARLLGTAGLLN